MAETLTDTNWDEHYIRRGDPSKSTYYIIRVNLPVNGIFSIITHITGHIRYALSKGWLPVVDMQNYPNVCLAPEKFGKENSWEYYFEQPLRIGLEQAYSGENVILSCNKVHPMPYWDNNIFYDNNHRLVTEWRMLTKLGLLRIKEELMKEIMELRAKLFSSKDRVLGVLLRGTDYFALKPKWHPVPPPPNLQKI